MQDAKTNLLGYALNMRLGSASETSAGDGEIPENPNLLRVNPQTAIYQSFPSLRVARKALNKLNLFSFYCHFEDFPSVPHLPLIKTLIRCLLLSFLLQRYQQSWPSSTHLKLSLHLSSNFLSPGYQPFFGLPRMNLHPAYIG